MQNPKGKFIYARDLYNFMKHNPDKMNQDDIHMYQHIFEIFQHVAENSPIYESYYYLGEMYLNGDYVVQNTEKAYRYFCVSASYNHALSFYKLYTLLKEHKIRKSKAIYSPLNNSLTIKGKYTEDEKALLFKYLRRAAEEGFVEAQFELANNYMNGELCKIDYKLALAWHRQACRNGYVLSYEPCGDLLYMGGSNLKKDKVLSLVMYFTAYNKGLFSLKDKILKIREELINEGEPLPEMVLI
jgi:TPR repeat protein